MDEAHLSAAFRHVALNPVRARLVERAEGWRWSSARAHLTGRDDGVTLLAPTSDRFPRFADLVEGDELEEMQAALRRAETIGRPLGDAALLTRVETALGRTLRAKPRGPKPKPKQRDENGELSRRNGQRRASRAAERAQADFPSASADASGGKVKDAASATTGAASAR